MFSKAFFALAFASTAFATVFVTTPTEATTYTGGQQGATVVWQDDGNTPSLANFGPSMISIYAGNAQQQTSLQLLNGNVDVSQMNSITFTPNPTIGPDSNEYFIRFESLSLKDASQPTIPALAFSHKFTLSGMSGAFSAVVSSQIAGQSTAPLLATVAASSSGSSPATSVPASTTVAATTSKKASSTASGSASATHTSAKSSAVGVKAGWAGALLSALVGATMF